MPSPLLQNLLIAAAFVAALVWLVLRERRTLNGRAWLLLRCLLPSWRFFEHLGDVPLLSYRVAGRESEFGAWLPALPPAERRLTSLWLDAQGNLRLACQSLVEQFVAELEEGGEGDASELISYQLIQNLVAWRLRTHTLPAAGYQFRLTSSASEGEAVFLSAVHAWPASP